MPQSKQMKAAILRQLTEAARRAYKRGLQTGNGGNISARIPGSEQMLVTASGGSFMDCDAGGSGWVSADFNGAAAAGSVPSREAAMHGFLYRRYPEVMAVVHCHAPYSIAWAAAENELPFVSWQASLKLGHPVPVIAQRQPAVSPKECERIAAHLEKSAGLLCFLLREHGLVAMGATPLEAEHLAEFVEECAQIAVLKRLMGVKLFTGAA